MQQCKQLSEQETRTNVWELYQNISKTYSVNTAIGKPQLMSEE